MNPKRQQLQHALELLADIEMRLKAVGIALHHAKFKPIINDGFMPIEYAVGNWTDVLITRIELEIKRIEQEMQDG